jgi:hypothetical protein
LLKTPCLSSRMRVFLMLLLPIMINYLEIVIIK